MAKITSLAEITTVDSDDLLNVVDVSDTTYSASGTNKKVKKSDLIKDLTVNNLASGVLDTDLSSVSGNDDTIPSAKATKTYADTKSPNLGFTKIASGKVTNTTNGVSITIPNSGLYLVFTEGWVASTSGKAGFAICSNISGGYGYVDTIKSGAYSGTVTMPSATTIKIVPYNADGCIYLVLGLNIW